jgi:riboflavin biosynthesis pyrimidine reductase
MSPPAESRIAELIHTLFQQEAASAPPALTPALRDLYDGDLRFPAVARRPYVVANFVSTLDGVASYSIPGESGGATISGSDPGDRFIMGLLRASADAVMVGARTVQDVSPDDLWIPEFTYPEAEQLFADYRQQRLRKSRYPLIIIVSGSARLDLKRKVFQSPEIPTLILTSVTGKVELEKAGIASCPWLQVRTLADLRSIIAPGDILNLLASEFDIHTVLHEGGPSLLGQFVKSGFIDELFLTMAPQIAGRAAGTHRPAIAQGIEFTPAEAPWFDLLSVKQGAGHLYLRYRRREMPADATNPHSRIETQDKRRRQ